MDNKLLVTKSLTLLWRESQIPEKQENSVDTIRTAMDGIKEPEVNISLLGSEDSPITKLKALILEMCKNPAEHEYIKEDLLLTIKSNCGDDTALYESIEQGINQEMTPAVLKRSVVNLRRDLIGHFKDESVMQILARAANDFRYNKSKFKSTAAFLTEVITQLEPYQVTVQKKDPAINERVSIEDESGVETIFNTVQNENSGNGIMSTPWQAMNDMLDGGFRPGEFVMHMSLQHQYKTGLNLLLFRGFPIYNKPFLIHPDKKPLLIRISLEDPLSNNFQFLYKAFKENEDGRIYEDEFNEKIDEKTGETIQIPKISAKEKARYVSEKMKVNGWHIELLSVNPIEWTYRDLCNLIIEREAEGYEVKVCDVDYLLKLPTTGCTQNFKGGDYRNLIERIKAFFAARKCIFMTPWQLSTDAKSMIRDGTPDVVTRWVGGGFTDSCKSLDQVVDVGILAHRVCKDREWFLDIALDKLRRIKQPADDKRRFALKFNNTHQGRGVILDDIGKENSAYRKPGGERLVAKNEDETYYDF